MQKLTQCHARRSVAFIQSIDTDEQGAVEGPQEMLQDFAQLSRVTLTNDSDDGSGDDGTRCCRILQQTCTKLKTMEIYVSKPVLNIPAEEDQSASPSIYQTIVDIDLQLKAITNLRKIVVRVFSGPPAPWLTMLMKDFGWIVPLGNHDKPM